MAGLASRRGRTVLVLALVLAALGCAYAFASGMGEAGDGASLAEGEPFLSVASEEVEEVTWTYGGVTATMAKQDGVWADADAAGASLDQSAAAELVSAAADASSNRSVSRSQEDEAMGLESSTVQASLVLSDGSTVSFEVGAATTDGSSCYACRDGAEDVQVVDIALLNAFSCSITDLYITEGAPGSSSITAFEVDRGGDVLSMTYFEDGSDSSYTSSYQWFLQDGEGLRALDKSKARTLANVVNRITWSSCVDTAYADDAAAAYGFDSPVLTATLSYTDSVTYDTGEVDDDGEPVYETRDEPCEFMLVVGSKAGSGAYYAQPAGSAFVYTVSAESVEDLLEATYETLRPDDVCLMDWDTVDSLDIVCDGEATTVAFVRTEEQDDDGETVISTSYEADGASVDASAVSSVTDAIDALESEGEGTAGGAQGGADAELSITFHRSTSTYETMTLGFIRYDNSFYLVSFNGEERLLVNRNDVAALKEAIAGL